jgi:SAM-dependent methyltransferase
VVEKLMATKSNLATSALRIVARLVGIPNSSRIIIDDHLRLNFPAQRAAAVDTSINKEAASREILFAVNTPSGRFLEIGSGDGKLTYLLGISGNFVQDNALYRENRQRFDAKFQYCGMDLKGSSDGRIIGGDICSPNFTKDRSNLVNSCAAVYSNNVFEHLRQPWQAARNILALLQVGGMCITVVPFSQRYHESPGDYFRYTHKGIESLFEDAGKIEVIRSGYDIMGRRNDWQGSGLANDTVPEDEFGAWRETWFTFLAFRKVGA